jgi:hypothetical protein
LEFRFLSPLFFRLRSWTCRCLLSLACLSFSAFCQHTEAEQEMHQTNIQETEPQRQNEGVFVMLGEVTFNLPLLPVK